MGVIASHERRIDPKDYTWEKSQQALVHGWVYKLSSDAVNRLLSFTHHLPLYFNGVKMGNSYMRVSKSVLSTDCRCEHILCEQHAISMALLLEGQRGWEVQKAELRNSVTWNVFPTLILCQTLAVELLIVFSFSPEVNFAT